MSQVQAQTAFNLIIEGVGYLNRIRLVTPKKGPVYKACTINAMMGMGDAVEYVSIDCRIVGKQADEAVGKLLDAVKAKEKVIVGFRASDPKPDAYDYEHNGETKHAEGLKARLLQLTFAKVNGQRIEIPLVERPNSQSRQAQGGEGADVGPASEHRASDAAAEVA